MNLHHPSFVFASTDLLKHDKFLSKKPPPAHLSEVPVYLRDAATEEASKNVKLSRAAMGIDNLNKQRGSRRGFSRFGKNRDPLKSFSAEVNVLGLHAWNFLLQ